MPRIWKVLRYNLINNCGPLSDRMFLGAPHLSQCEANNLAISSPTARLSATTWISFVNRSAISRINLLLTFVFGNGLNRSTGMDSKAFIAAMKNIACLRRIRRNRLWVTRGQNRGRDVSCHQRPIICPTEVSSSVVAIHFRVIDETRP